jgi:hypothetical protein
MTNIYPKLTKKKKADLKNLEFSRNNNKNIKKIFNKKKV